MWSYSSDQACLSCILNSISRPFDTEYPRPLTSPIPPTLSTFSLQSSLVCKSDELLIPLLLEILFCTTSIPKSVKNEGSNEYPIKVVRQLLLYRQMGFFLFLEYSGIVERCRPCPVRLSFLVRVWACMARLTAEDAPH